MHSLARLEVADLVLARREAALFSSEENTLGVHSLANIMHVLSGQVLREKRAHAGRSPSGPHDSMFGQLKLLTRR